MIIDWSEDPVLGAPYHTVPYGTTFPHSSSAGTRSSLRDSKDKRQNQSDGLPDLPFPLYLLQTPLLPLLSPHPRDSSLFFPRWTPLLCLLPSLLPILLGHTVCAAVSLAPATTRLLYLQFAFDFTFGTTSASTAATIYFIDLHLDPSPSTFVQLPPIPTLASSPLVPTVDPLVNQTNDAVKVRSSIYHASHYSNQNTKRRLCDHDGDIREPLGSIAITEDSTVWAIPHPAAGNVVLRSTLLT